MERSKERATLIRRFLIAFALIIALIVIWIFLQTVGGPGHK